MSGLAAWRALVRLLNGNDLTHAAAIAYYALLSLFPFLLLVFSILGWVTADAEDRLAVLTFVFSYFPTQFDFVNTQLIALRETSVRIGVAGGLGLMWASLGVFGAITSAVNEAWGVEKQRSFLKHRLVSFLMLVAGGGVMIVALLLVSAVKVAEASWFGVMLTRFQWLQALRSCHGRLVRHDPPDSGARRCLSLHSECQDPVSRRLGRRNPDRSALAGGVRRFLLVHRVERRPDADPRIDRRGGGISAVGLRVFGHPYVRRGIHSGPFPTAPAASGRSAGGADTSTLTMRRFSLWVMTLCVSAVGCQSIEQSAAKFSLVSVEDEIDIGKETNAQIRKELPELTDAETTAYISAIGERLVRAASGPKYPYTFSVANYREINAFALPGRADLATSRRDPRGDERIAGRGRSRP